MARDVTPGVTAKTLERIKVNGTTVLLSHWVPYRAPHQARARVTVIDEIAIEHATLVARDLLAAPGLEAEITDRRSSSLVEARDPGPVLEAGWPIPESRSARSTSPSAEATGGQRRASARKPPTPPRRGSGRLELR